MGNAARKISQQKNPVMPRLVADDNGYADHKLAWLDENGKIMTGKVSSKIQVGGQGFSSTQGERRGAYTVGEVEYTCSTAVTSPMELRNGDYPFSTANRVLFNHALTRFGLLGMPVEAAVTLPFRDYYASDGTVNIERRERCAQNFSQRDVSVLGSEAQPDVKSIKVYAEALSAWFDWAIDDDGDLTERYQELVDLQGEMLVVDIGGSTTDLASLQIVNETTEGEMLINHGKSGTEKAGVLDAKAKLEELVRGRMIEQGVSDMSGHTGTLPSAFIDRVMLNGVGLYAGQRRDFNDLRDQACNAVAERIVSYIKSRVGNLTNYYAVLVVGGGAIVFEKWIKQAIPNAVFSDEFANARGALKFLRDQREAS